MVTVYYNDSKISEDILTVSYKEFSVKFWDLWECKRCSKHMERSQWESSHIDKQSIKSWQDNSNKHEWKRQITFK